MTTDPTNPAHVPEFATGGVIPGAGPRLTTADLTSAHLGRVVTIESTRPAWSVSGTLWRAEHQVSRISERQLCDPIDDPVPGSLAIHLEVGPARLDAEGTETVTLHPAGARS